MVDNEETPKENESGEKEIQKGAAPSDNTGLKATLERAEEVLKGLQEESARLEELKAHKLLSGESNAGSGDAPKKEMTDEDYINYSNKALSNEL